MEKAFVLVPVEIPALLPLHYTILPSSAKWYLKLLAMINNRKSPGKSHFAGIGEIILETNLKPT